MIRETVPRVWSTEEQILVYSRSTRMAYTIHTGKNWKKKAHGEEEDTSNAKHTL